eukprot:4134282-Alexandrium_andersonii.AAC.1
MSASLVGSEMCIRDSVAVRARDLYDTPVRADLLGGLVWDFCARGGQDAGCLLYTSDAADDM